MSHATITASTKDQALLDRIQAAACKEAWNSVVYSETAYGERLRTWPEEALRTFTWPVCIEYEAPYEYALNSNNPDPGGDPTVITDANITSSVQAHWPRDVEVPLPPDMVAPTPGEP
jgi:hypothetical protein